MTAAHHSHSAMAGPQAGHLNGKHRRGVVPGGGSYEGWSLAVQHPQWVCSPGQLGLEAAQDKSQVLTQGYPQVARMGFTELFHGISDVKQITP